MKIGILGSGMVGKELAIGLTRVGHKVMIGSRDRAKLQEFTQKNKMQHGNFEETANFGEIIILATKWEGTKNAIEMAKKHNFSDKIVIDVTNPLVLNPETGTIGIETGPQNSGGEKVQRWLEMSKVVKAFNTISANTMINPKREEGDPDFFIAGNDVKAKETVEKLAKELGWKSMIDVGDINKSFYLEAMTMLWIDYAMKNKQWTHAFKILKK